MFRSLVVRSWLSAAAAGMLLAGPALGHAKLRSSIPAADVLLRAAPTSLTLTFNEDVRLAVLTLASGGKDIPLSIDRNAPAALKVSVALPALGAGTYVVRWSVLSPDDGHVSKGTFSFEIMASAASAAPAASPR